MSNVADLVGTSTVKDDGTLGLTGRRITGVRCVLEKCLRSIVTKRRSMRWAPGEGEDIRELENGDFSPTALERRRVAYEAAIRGVDFVIGAQTSLRLVGTLARFEAAITIAGAGTYPLAVTADKAGKVLADLGAT